MFQYWYRIYDRYGVDIAALAVFTGGKNQKRPDHFHKNFLGTEILYKYNVYHILDHTEEQLLEMNNPFALIVLAAQKALLVGKIPEEELGQQRLTIARALIHSNKYNGEQIRRFLYFLKTFVHIKNPAININFDKQIDLLTGNARAMGIIETITMLAKEEGIDKGRKEGRKEGREIEKTTIVQNLLTNTNFDTSKIAMLVDVSEAFVEKIRKQLKF